MLSENNIKFYTSENEDIKCAMVERFNRTLKMRMFRYFTHKSTSRYVDVLQDLVAAYNQSYHRTIKAAPVDVTMKNEIEIRSRTVRRHLPPKWKFAVGDKVRITQARKVFRKGYLPGWTNEIFVVKSRVSTDPATYRVADYDGDVLAGKFYAEELQNVTETADTLYDIERVIKTRRRAGATEHLVKWVGYPDKFNSWVSDIIVRNGQSDVH